MFPLHLCPPRHHQSRRRLFRLGAATGQAPQAAVEAATIAGLGESSTQEEDAAQD